MRGSLHILCHHSADPVTPTTGTELAKRAAAQPMSIPCADLYARPNDAKGKSSEDVRLLHDRGTSNVRPLRPTAYFGPLKEARRSNVRPLLLGHLLQHEGLIA